MARTAVNEHQTIDSLDHDLETLHAEHRHWRARLRAAIEDSRRLRTHAATFRHYCRDIDFTKC